MKNRVVNGNTLLVALLVCHPAGAENFSASLAANSWLSDNSLKKSEDPQDERQDSYTAGVKGSYSNSIIDADIGYQAYARTFDKKSQANEEYVDGSSSLVFGKKSDPLALSLKHSRRRLLATPDALDLVANQLDREILTAEPEIRKKIFDADQLFLRGMASQVRVSGSKQQDSNREGITAGWFRPLSSLSTFQAVTQQTKISYDELPAADYTYSSTAVSYDAQLRKLQYQLRLGYNQSEPENGEKESAPSYGASFIYRDGLQQLDVSANRMLTDSSFGGGNIDGINPLPGNDGLNTQVERLDRKSSEVRWTTYSLCDRCNFYVGLSWVVDDYLEEAQQLKSFYTSAGFSYSLSPSSSLSLSATNSEIEFDGDAPGRSYELRNAAVEYNYSFNQGLTLRLFGRRQERIGETAVDTYIENSFGGGLSYVF